MYEPLEEGQEMSMYEPLYPTVQGQAAPDLGLAAYGVEDDRTIVDPAHGAHFSDSMPPCKMDLPMLNESGAAQGLAQMGIAPDVPYFDLQLADARPAPTPAQLLAPQGVGAINPPTYALPDMQIPPLRMGDLTAPGLDPVSALAVDPQLGDLLQFVQPGGLLVVAATRDPLSIDPINPDFGEYDRPPGLGMPAPLTPDPTLPDLQQPQLTQAVHMPTRPGELAQAMLTTLHSDPTYRALPTRNERELYLKQEGSSRRSRHMGMLEPGLDGER